MLTGPYARASARARFQQALAGKNPCGLPHNSPADSELLTQFCFGWKLLPRLNQSSDDCLTQCRDKVTDQPPLVGKRRNTREKLSAETPPRYLCC
jgi:hypothetical protein